MFGLRNFIRSQFGKPLDYSADEIAKAGDVCLSNMARNAARFSDRTIIPDHPWASKRRGQHDHA